MKLSKKAIFAGALAFGLIGATTTQAEQYKGTAYVAGMGGHFAVAEFTINPKSDTPITISSLDKIDIGDGHSHPVHDARIDYKDRDTMFWSTYKPDHDANDVYHYGKTDLKSGDKVVDMTFPIPQGTMSTKAGFCASAQTANYFMPISMNKPGYIAIVNKDTMKTEHTVFLEGTDADIHAGVKYTHGINSPDMKEILITMNESDVAAKDKELGNGIGKLHMVVLDAAALEKGKVKVLRKGIADGNLKKTISFRQYYSPDGSMIANATGDIMFLVDAKTLKVLDSETMPSMNENHDAIFTPDGKYAILTLRTKTVLPGCADPTKPADGEWRMDGQLALYDVAAKKIVGKATSSCLACHDEQIGTDEDAPHAVLCGLDVNWAK